MRTRTQRLLLIWLYAVAAIEVICCAVRFTHLDHQGLGLYLDPRLPFIFLEAALRGEDSFLISPIVAGVIVAIFATRISRGGMAAFAYVLFESLYGLLTISLFLIVILIGMSAAHGFSPQELVMPGVAYFVVSFVPAILAIRVYKASSLRALAINQGV